MVFLAENIKNLGVRIKQLDKKIEKRLVSLLGAQLKEQLTEENIQSPYSDFKQLFVVALNL